jgi:hypothetical protein
MAQRHYLVLAGPTTVEITDRVATEDWELTEKAEEGAVGSGSLWIADPDMDLDIDGLRDYYVLEDTSEATDNVLFGGFAVDPELSRGEEGGMHYDPVGRNWQIQLTDRNGYWNRRVMVGADCKRPAETDVARVQWLYASSEAAWIEDDTTYVSTASTGAMDKVDYRGQYLDQLMRDVAEHKGKNWWVQLQETGTGREDVAWYGKDGLTAYASDLYLSNDPADWDDDELADGTSLVWPIGSDAVMARDDSRIYTGGYLRYANGRKAIYRTNSTSAAVYGRRDAVFDAPNVKTKAKAEARLTRLLADCATADERVRLSVVLPAAKATMIRAGMRVRVKATHLEGYGDQFYWMRVLSCAVKPQDAGTRYRLALVLQLSAEGEDDGGAGDGPYAGDAFAALLYQVATWDEPYIPEMDDTGDNPPLSYGERPTVGDMWTFETDPITGEYTGITTSRSMMLRIELHISFRTVGGPLATASAAILGQSQSVVKGTSLSAWNVDFDFDFEEFVTAGTTIAWNVSQDNFLTGGWLDAPLTTYLYVGRGTQHWGGSTWEGA